MMGFKELRDAAKINVKPEKIKLVSVKSSGTLAQALNSYGIPSNRHKELAIVNGMETNSQVSAGTSIKIVGK
jgi:predicted Zn-dependent protease